MIVETIGECYLFQFGGDCLNDVKCFDEDCNFEQVFNKFRNSGATNKIHIYFTSTTMTPKHVRHLHTQNRLFYKKNCKRRHVSFSSNL